LLRNVNPKYRIPDTNEGSGLGSGPESMVRKVKRVRGAADSSQEGLGLGLGQRNPSGLVDRHLAGLVTSAVTNRSTL